VEENADAMLVQKILWEQKVEIFARVEGVTEVPAQRKDKVA
jgi:hypothetical protein